MAKIWSSYIDVDDSVSTIKTVLAETGTLPAILVTSYKETLERTSKGMVQRFYEKLVEHCPEALRYFMDEKTG